MRKQALPRFLFVYTGYLYLVFTLLLLIHRTLNERIFFTTLEYKLMIFGFIGLLIFGMSYNLIPIFSRRIAFYSNKLITIHLFLANVAILFLILSYFDLERTRLHYLGFLVTWMLGVFLYIFNIIMTVRIPPHDYKVPVSENTIKLDKMASKFTVASGIHVLLGSILLFFEGTVIPFPVIIHWHTTGFIMLMIIGVGFHVFPRITKVSIPYKATYFSLPGIIAPTFLALSRMSPLWNQILFIIGATLEYSAVGSFSIALMYMILKSSRRRIVTAYYFTSALAMLIGLGWGFLFGFFPELITSQLQVHAFINLFGIVTFLIFGVSFQMIFFYPTLPKIFKQFSQAFIYVAYLLGMLTVIWGYFARDHSIMGGGLMLMMIAAFIGALGITLSPLLIKWKLIRLEKEAKEALDV